MESSEDDAGAATVASRRTSAREKDIGRIEDVSATSSSQPDSSEPRSTSENLAMSEDNFDGDSVPSPTTHDVNTSTEAILDMIDEIVDGPGAPKRLPFALDTDDGGDLHEDTEHPESVKETVINKSATQSPSTADSNSAKSDKVLSSDCVEVHPESTSLSSETSTGCIVTPLPSSPKQNNVDTSQLSSPMPGCVDTPQPILSKPDSEEQLQTSSPKPSSYLETQPNLPKLGSDVQLQPSQSSQKEPGSSDELLPNSPKPVTDNKSQSKSRMESSDDQSEASSPQPDSNKGPNLSSLCTDVEQPLSPKLPLVGSLQTSPYRSVCDNTQQLKTSKLVCDNTSETRSLELICDDTSLSVSKPVCDFIPQSRSPKPLCDDVLQECSSELNSNNTPQPSSPKLIHDDTPEPSSSKTAQDDILKLSSLKPIGDHKPQPSSPKPGSNDEPKPISPERVCDKIPQPSSPKPVRDKPQPSFPKEICDDTPQPSSPKQVCDDIPQPSVYKPSCNHPAETIDVREPVASCLEQPLCASSQQNIPSSSESQTSEPIIESNSAPSKRTVKCVTSSDNRDTVTVESAESTSSDNSVSKGRVQASESITRSPLRRRLVRPAPSDRRPDSTVSSTVDSQSIIHASEQSSECVVVKDVSSSSDAVPLVHGNVKPEEIRNVSEVSICQAETSTCPPKKIKLIRQKFTPQVTHIVTTEIINDKPVQVNDTEQCQSTSSENLSTDSISCLSTASTSCMSLSKADKVSEKSELIPASISIETESVQQSSESTNNEMCHSNNDETQIKLCSPKLNLPPCVSMDCSETQTTVRPTEDKKAVLPIKLNVSEPSSTAGAEKQNVMFSEIQDSIENIHTEQVTKVTKPIASSTKATEDKKDTHIIESNIISETEPEFTKQVPKLTIKLGNKSAEEIKPPVPKLTIKPIRPPSQGNQDKVERKDQIPSVTKINIKPIPQRPEKVTDLHRKSSSSEISESECSENDDSTSTSDQTSASDQGPPDVVPKVTIKLGKPGTETEGKFYTEKNIPKLTIKGLHNNENEEQTRGTESPSKLKVIISQSDEKQSEKVPKLTIKNVAKVESQPLSPKLIIKPIKPPDNLKKDNILAECDSQLKISTESYPSSTDNKEIAHVPKITIKPVTKMDNEALPKTSKKIMMNDDHGHLPVVTKLNIKPIVKPTECGETSDILDSKVPVVPKLNIKPIVKPKDSEVDSNREDIPKITKLNIKPIKSPETNCLEEKDSDDLKAAEHSIPVVTKLNIKPIVKPDEDVHKDSENQSSETGNSSDDNTDQIPVVTKLNIKPICKPNDADDCRPSSSSNEGNIPVVTKLNIKPLVKPDEGSKSPSSPKKDTVKSDSKYGNLMKLNIKPVVKPEDMKSKATDDIEDFIVKNPPIVMKINMKAKVDSNTNENVYSIEKNDCTVSYNNVNESIPTVSKLNIKPIVKPPELDIKIEVISNEEKQNVNCSSNIKVSDQVDPKLIAHVKSTISDHLQITEVNLVSTENCVLDSTDKNTLKHSSVNFRQLKGQELKSSSTDVPKNDLSRDTAQETVKKESLKLDGFSKNTEHTNLNTVCKESKIGLVQSKQHSPSRQNCTLLKKLLEVRKDVETVIDDSKTVQNCFSPPQSRAGTISPRSRDVANKGDAGEKLNSEKSQDKLNEVKTPTLKVQSIQDLCKEVNESVTKPLEINISDKVTNQNSDQDSPRIILKINKTDHGPSAKIITEDSKRPETPTCGTDNTQNYLNDMANPNRVLNSRRKVNAETNTPPMGKRLRSSRIVQSAELPIIRRGSGKRMSTTECKQLQSKEPELSVLETKRLKLGQLLSNKALTITPIMSKSPHLSPTKHLENKQAIKTTNHSLLNNENCSKNGNSKLHNILSNLQAKQIQSLPFDIHCTEKNHCLSSELESSTSTGSSDVVSVILPAAKSQPEIHEMIFHDNSESRDFNITPDEMSQDPLEVDSSKVVSSATSECLEISKIVDMTPQPKKRGRPRKIPLSEGAKPVVTLPVPALEERPQRSLRLSRERPVVIVKPKRGRGRGRGRGRRVVEAAPTPPPEPVVEANRIFAEQKEKEKEKEQEIDPTSSRIKLPRMTEALDKMPSMCSTPLTSRRRSSSEFFGETAELKVVMDNALPKSPLVEDSVMKSPEVVGEWRRGRGGRGRGRGRGAGRTPRGGRGRGRGGGRGAMYMKETMGIYGRVCGPATTTVQLFEEETCMMDDNATPAKPSHLLDEDSQSSVKSSTNESNKMKKSKFADLFDSNKVWTAADVKEYMWPPPERPDVEPQVMMIQEQVAMFLSVKSFKRRYPELKRRTITGEERDYVLSKGLVTEALCDLGITAVDASEVLDIMLSDYPHKYEEYRSHQRERQRAEAAEAAQAAEEPPGEVKTEEKPEKTEVKVEMKPVESKPEPPKVDPEKTRQDAMLAAMASVSEWNARFNASRPRACADLQSLGVLRRRAPPGPAPAPAVCPPHGLYPHALLPGQYQHSYRTYTAHQLRYFPLNTAMEAPPAPPSPVWSSDSEPEVSSRGSSSDHSDDAHRPAKRKKLTKTKRSSHAEAGCSTSQGAGGREEARGAEEAETCRACKLRLEANRKYTHERFLVCATCNAKLHPSCVELSADTIRKCREYAWQCAECKSCCGCARRADDDKMLFCDLCDRGFHIYCVGLPAVPGGRWHCAECAVCKSCGAREPAGDWHHQTRRGPGGHKVYSHSLCTPCARAYRIGRYCPLCERSFIGPKGTMQLVICKLCDRQLHQECVRPTVSSLNVLDYTCGECRKGGITSRAAAVRLAPRTIATLFMAKRRFNKYAHRQYLASRQRALEDGDPAPAPAEGPDPPESPDASDADPLAAAD